jgi:outer membrane autotransporter protein
LSPDSTLNATNCIIDYNFQNPAGESQARLLGSSPVHTVALYVTGSLEGAPLLECLKTAAVDHNDDTFLMALPKIYSSQKTLHQFLNQPSQFKALELSQQHNSIAMSRTLLSRLGRVERAAPFDAIRLNLWAETQASTLKQSSIDHFIGFNANTVSGVVGLEILMLDIAPIGVAGSFGHTAIDWQQEVGKGSIMGYYVGAYGSSEHTYFDLQSSFIASWNRYEVDRSIAFAGFKREASHYHHGQSISAHIGLNGHLADSLAFLSPFVGADYNY